MEGRNGALGSHDCSSMTMMRVNTTSIDVSSEPKRRGPRALTRTLMVMKRTTAIRAVREATTSTAVTACRCGGPVGAAGRKPRLAAAARRGERGGQSR